MSNVFDKQGNLITGAGGGQAGELSTSPTGDLPVDAPGPIQGTWGVPSIFHPPAGADLVMPATDTAADLHRWFCESSWCSKCGFVFDEGQHEKPRTGGVQCETMALPGLHTRCPETRVEGLRWNPAIQLWVIEGHCIRTYHAADLLVMGVVKAKARKRQLAVFMESAVDVLRECNWKRSLPEAVAIAGHRAADAEERG